MQSSGTPLAVGSAPAVSSAAVSLTGRRGRPRDEPSRVERRRIARGVATSASSAGGPQRSSGAEAAGNTSAPRGPLTRKPESVRGTEPLGGDVPLGDPLLGQAPRSGVITSAVGRGESLPEALEPAVAPPFPSRAPFIAGRAVDHRVTGGCATPAPGLAAPRALVVDDDPEVRRALARLLRPELDVHLAGSVAQAAAVLELLDRVDLAFVDWELPDGTGEEILERLAAWPDAIRVLISARLSGSGGSLGEVPSSQLVNSRNPLKNRALANLVLGKPVASGVVEALKRAALALPQG